MTEYSHWGIKPGRPSTGQVEPPHQPYTLHLLTLPETLSGDSDHPSNHDGAQGPVLARHWPALVFGKERDRNFIEATDNHD